MLIKICGNTRPEDAELAFQNGADLLGIIFAKSPRQVTSIRAQEIMNRVGSPENFAAVFVNESLDTMIRFHEQLGFGWIQLHGEESAETAHELRRSGVQIIKACRVQTARDVEMLKDYPADFLLFDTYSPHAHGGTGKTFNWEILKQCAGLPPFFLSGGISIENMEKAVREIRPDGIDAASSLESRPGEKDPAKLTAFLEKAKGLSRV